MECSGEMNILENTQTKLSEASEISVNSLYDGLNLFIKRCTCPMCQTANIMPMKFVCGHYMCSECEKMLSMIRLNTCP